MRVLFLQCNGKHTQTRTGGVRVSRWSSRTFSRFLSVTSSLLLLFFFDLLFRSSSPVFSYLLTAAALFCFIISFVCLTSLLSFPLSTHGSFSFPLFFSCISSLIQIFPALPCCFLVLSRPRLRFLQPPARYVDSLTFRVSVSSDFQALLAAETHFTPFRLEAIEIKTQ